MQRNWIGRSVGATVRFTVDNHDAEIEVFTTRPDTLYGVTFMTLAPEHDLVNRITTSDHKAEVDRYVKQSANRSERDRMSDVKNITGVFTGGAMPFIPLSGKKYPFGLETMFLLAMVLVLSWQCHVEISETLNLPSISTSPLQIYSRG